jgi:hypothetical protein
MNHQNQRKKVCSEDLRSKMQNSLDNIEPSDVKEFFRKLSVVSGKHVHNPVSGIPSEKKLHAKVRELEKELQNTKRERDGALKENRYKINELSNALVSIKTVIHEMLEDKKHRIRYLEKKISKQVKI